MRIILRSWGLMILCGFISLEGLRAQQPDSERAIFPQVQMLGANFRTVEAPVAGKWLEAQDFAWELPGIIRIQARDPLLVKWNAAQDSLQLDSIAGRGGDFLMIDGTEMRFRGKMLVRQGLMAGNVTLEAPGIIAKGGKLEVSELGVKMYESEMRFLSLDGGATMAEITGEFKYGNSEPNSVVIRPALSTFAKFCNGKWLSPVNDGKYDLRRHELLFADPRRLMTPLYVVDNSAEALSSGHRRTAYLTSARISILLDSGLVNASMISNLLIADAKIELDGDSLTIDRNGNILDAKDAEIWLNTGAATHIFSSANVTFPTCSTYAARGFYEVLLAGGREQRIPMELKLLGDTLTTAHGDVDGPGFYLNEGFQYRGAMDVDRRYKEIRCKGVIQVDLKHPYFEGKWFPIDQRVDPDFVVLDLFGGVPTDSTLSCGLHLDSLIGPYPTFVGKKYHAADHDLLRAWGSMAYDGQRRAFSIGSRDLLLGQDYRGCVVHFTIDSTNVIAEGPLQLPAPLNPIQAGLQCTVSAKEVAAEHEVQLSLLGTLDLKALPKNAIQRITDRMRMALVVNESFDPRFPGMQVPLANLLDPDPERKPVHYRKFLQATENAVTAYEMNLGAHLPFSALVFSITELRWDPQFSSLWQTGPIAILSSGGEGVNKFTNSNTKTELRSVPDPNGGPSHAELRMYIELDELNWLYYHFTADGLSFASSDADLMNELRKEKPRKTNRLTLLTEADKDQYLINFVNAYIWRTGR